MEALEFTKWGQVGEQQVDGEVVPAGEVWLVQTCGIATNNNSACDYMMQIVRAGHFHPLFKNEAPQGSTPVLAVNRSFILIPGDMLKARVNGGSNYQQMCLLYSGWKMPIEKLPYLIY